MTGRLASIALAAVAALSLAGPSRATSPLQRAMCIRNGTKRACRTPMRLVCHIGGKTTLSQIPRGLVLGEVGPSGVMIFFAWGNGKPSELSGGFPTTYQWPPTTQLTKYHRRYTVPTEGGPLAQANVIQTNGLDTIIVVKCKRD